jgi:hypothetical protein
VIPIPGTKSTKRIEENANAFTVLPLSSVEIAEIEAGVSVVGDRYPESMMSSTFNERL